LKLFWFADSWTTFIPMKPPIAEFFYINGNDSSRYYIIYRYSLGLMVLINDVK